MIRIKICGFTRRQDLKEALALGIDFVGFNFWPSSPRYLSPGQAKTLITGLRLTARTVGVFVDADLSLIKDAAVNLRLDGIQLHGKEGPETVAKLKEMFPQTMIIKAIRVGQPHDLENIYRYPADFFLLDSFSPVMAGGTGRMLDLEFLRKTVLAWDWERIFLAGGIKPGNVFRLLSEFKPYAIDVASGVETSPGVKSKRLMARLIDEVRRVESNESKDG